MLFINTIGTRLSASEPHELPTKINPRTITFCWLISWIHVLLAKHPPLPMYVHCTLWIPIKQCRNHFWYGRQSLFSLSFATFTQSLSQLHLYIRPFCDRQQCHWHFLAPFCITLSSTSTCRKLHHVKVNPFFMCALFTNNSEWLCLFIIRTREFSASSPPGYNQINCSD